MKPLLNGLFILLASVGYCQKVEIAFRIPEKDLIPEGIAYDPATRSFFVSSIFKNKIVRIDAGQKVNDFITSGKDGIGQVLGMKVNDGKLWACSNTSEGDPNGQAMIHLFDIATGNLVMKWVLQSNGETHLFNDLVVDDKGNAFISDSDYSAIYRVHKSLEKPELWIKDDRLRFANGITLLPSGELIVNASNGFFKINTTKEIKSLPFLNYFPLGIDGLSFYKNSLIGIQNVTYPVSINQYFLTPSFDQIERAKVLAYDHPKWDTPTTGVIVGNWFYFVANSQLGNLDQNKIKDASKLKEVLIMKLQLE